VDKAAAHAPHITAYAYCENHPINFNDPDGNFKTKFGAWLYRASHSSSWGGTIERANKGEWYVGKQVKYQGTGSDVGVAYKRVFDWSGRNQSRSESRNGNRRRSSSNSSDYSKPVSNRGGVSLKSDKSGWTQGPDRISTDPDIQDVNVDNMPFLNGFGRPVTNIFEAGAYYQDLFNVSGKLTESVMEVMPPITSNSQNSDLDSNGVVSHRYINEKGEVVSHPGWRKDSLKQSNGLKQFFKVLED
jgi:hypothetical protein